MKNMKKFVAIATALTMVMAPMTAFAATNLEQDGDINYTNTTIYKLTLPTTEGMAFTLDPQGLLSLDGEAYDESEAGKIVATTPMVAKNQSSVDVLLTAKFYLTDEADETGAAFVEEITEADDTGAQIEKEIAMTVTATDGENTVINVLGNDEVEAEEFAMDSVEYKFEKDGDNYKYVQANDEDATELEFQIGGFIAKDYEWDAYTGAEAKKITLHAVFSFKNAEGTEEVENTVVEEEEEEVIVIENTTIAGDAYSRSNTANTFAVTWATAMTSENKTIKSMYLSTDGVDYSTMQIPAAAYSISENTITIDGTKNTVLGTGGIGKTRYIKVTFGDDTSAIITLTNITE